MIRLTDDIVSFLESKGFACSRQMCEGADVIYARNPDWNHSRVILPLEISADSMEEACMAREKALCRIGFISVHEGYPLIISEDRWHSQKEMMQARLLAHLEVYSQAYARNCEVRRIEKAEAQAFLQSCHSYGYAACRYHYGLFLKRSTGHLSGSGAVPGTLIAVATFSNARKWVKDGMEIRSYEWTRFASLPGMRISGGMGKMLKAFISEVHPDDIMSYADLEWSEGGVYRQLGFSLEESKGPVTFAVDTRTWTRFPIRQEMTDPMTGNRFFQNFGSNKYRLKLTDYK